ncbi:hypothetical protein HK096_000680 [Nowakowskiella sp. JEL0078]|nr:hypothetical protein HK096_000680 [Nowakowskiella sp. JEL0078]
MSAKGSTYLITGCTTGLGYHCVSALARNSKTAHTSISAIVLACRRPTHAQKVADEIAEKEGVDRSLLVVLNEPLDLFNLESIRTYVAAVKKFLDESGHRKLDVLVNNAGIGASGYLKNSLGREKIFATNHLGPFLLTILLLPFITTRVVNVSSEVHDPKEISILPDASFSWPTTTEDYDKYFAAGEPLSGDDEFTAGRRSYCRSKLCNVLFTNELARRCSNDLPYGVDEEVSTKISILSNKQVRCSLPNASTLRSVSFNPGLMFDTAFITGKPSDEIPEWASGMLHIVRKASDSGANLAAIATGELRGDVTATYFSDLSPKLTSEFSRTFETIVIHQSELWDHSVRWAGITSEELKNSGF